MKPALEPLAADPFTVLGLPEAVDDAQVRARYLALVRDHSPERDPEGFAAIRAAYEAVRTRRDRLRLGLFAAQGMALARLKRAALTPADPAERASGPHRPDRKTVNAVLREGVDRWAESVLKDALKE